MYTDRLYARTGKKIIATKNRIEPPVFARKGQNGVAQARTPGAEAVISPLGPTPVVSIMSREERPDSCRKLARGPAGPSAKRPNGLA